MKRRLVITIERVEIDYYTIDIPEPFRATLDEAESPLRTPEERDRKSDVMHRIRDLIHPLWVIKNGEKVTNTGTLQRRDSMRVTECRSYVLPESKND